MTRLYFFIALVDVLAYVPASQSLARGVVSSPFACPSKRTHRGFLILQPLINPAFGLYLRHALHIAFKLQYAHGFLLGNLAFR